jgi:eukaryotic-like serine/threonine-protein kinase
MLTPETVLQNRYRIIRQLGQGGMGAVYEAIDERLDTTIALKETLFGDERLRKQFEREARLLARLHHPALPRVSDHFDESEGQFLVMQFIPGHDLSEMIASRRGPFPVDQVLSWADQLLDALDYLHTQEPQIIHRDIKPQNLKLTSRGQIILLDFGLAKGQTSEVSRVTTSASIFGYTPNYAPLEQVQGLGTDPRSDIYSLSATLYHLITGVKPPDALTRAAAIVNGQSDPLQPANEVNSGVSVDTANVLAQGMAQNRDQRYQSADAMRRALKGSGEAATLLNRSEANTVLFPPAATASANPTVANASPQTVMPAGTPATVAPGETTVVRKPSGTAKRISSWMYPVSALVLLLAGGVCFFAYHQMKNTSNSAAPAAVASPTVTPAASAASSPSEVKQEQPQSAKAQPTAAPPETTAQKSRTDSARRSEKQKEKSEKSEAKANTDEDEDDDVPEPPEVDSSNSQRGRGRGAGQRHGEGSVRTFPDGTKLLTGPDGSRIMIRPDGTRQIITGPGGRPPRRVPPKPPYQQP